MLFKIYKEKRSKSLTHTFASFYISNNSYQFSLLWEAPEKRANVRNKQVPAAVPNILDKKNDLNINWTTRNINAP